MINRRGRNLIAEGIDWTISVTQIVILVHGLVKNIQIGTELRLRLGIRRVGVFEELHGARHTRLQSGILIRLANGQTSTG